MRRSPRSLRTRLTAGYAAVALVATLLFGTILAFALPPFLTQVERAYARTAAADVATRLKEAGGIGPENAAKVTATATEAARSNRVRIRITYVNGRPIADTGSAGLSARPSEVSYEQAFTTREGTPVARILVTDGPRAGEGLTARIAWAWAIAGTLAVLVSAGFGWLLAGRVSQPIRKLTRVSSTMADGDLTVRADVTGDAEVRTLAAAFNEMADAIEVTFDSLRRFVGDAAHEIATPLTALQADLELARDAPADPSVPALLDRSTAHAERIGLLTRDLLALSRLESIGVAEGTDVDLHALAHLILDGFASRAEQAQIELLLESCPGALVVIGDSTELARALSNLIDNALKYTPAGGTVTLSLERRGTDALVRVTDTGRGIASEELPHVFERFHRGRDAAPIPGSGLGLAIVKAIVTAHDGEIDVVSSPGATTIDIWLPLAEARPQA